MHDPLRNAFMVEMENLLAEEEVFEQRRAAGTQSKAVLIIGNSRPVVRREIGRCGQTACHLLMRFATAGR
jgi:hypothetical protein